MQKLTVTVAEATTITGLGRSTLYRLFAEKKITPRKSGKRTLVPVAELQRYVESLPPASINTRGQV